MFRTAGIATCIVATTRIIAATRVVTTTRGATRVVAATRVITATGVVTTASVAAAVAVRLGHHRVTIPFISAVVGYRAGSIHRLTVRLGTIIVNRIFPIEFQVRPQVELIAHLFRTAGIATCIVATTRIIAAGVITTTRGATRVIAATRVVTAASSTAAVAVRLGHHRVTIPFISAVVGYRAGSIHRLTVRLGTIIVNRIFPIEFQVRPQVELIAHLFRTAGIATCIVATTRIIAAGVITTTRGATRVIAATRVVTAASSTAAVAVRLGHHRVTIPLVSAVVGYRAGSIYRLTVRLSTIIVNRIFPIEFQVRPQVELIAHLFRTGRLIVTTRVITTCVATSVITATRVITTASSTAAVAVRLGYIRVTIPFVSTFIGYRAGSIHRLTVRLGTAIVDRIFPIEFHIRP